MSDVLQSLSEILSQGDWSSLVPKRGSEYDRSSLGNPIADNVMT